jgi:hypothetical protein
MGCRAPRLRRAMAAAAASPSPPRKGPSRGGRRGVRWGGRSEERRRSEAGWQGGGKGRGATPRLEGRDKRKNSTLESRKARIEAPPIASRVRGGWVENPVVKKKRRRGARHRDSTGMRNDFGRPSSPVKLFTLYIGLKKMICDVGMGTKFGEKYFNCHGSL